MGKSLPDSKCWWRSVVPRVNEPMVLLDEKWQLEVLIVVGS